MAAYVMGEIDVKNPAAYDDYRKQVLATLQKYGGRFLVRGNPCHVLEGDWPERRRVLIEFPSAEAARKWWDSTEYARPKAMRRAHSNGRLLLMEGA